VRRPRPRVSVPARSFAWFVLSVLAGFAAAGPGFAHPVPRETMDAARIRQALERMTVTGSALYIAAHPDDENTAFLAWLANGRKVRTAYLSVTRGDGGQNLIGSDTGSLLGVIRTNELLAARHIDGAGQFFTRAVDFGFSKGPEETLELWGKERTLGDVVWVIRSFRPDVIVTRFAPDGSGHGHHTASAILAHEAFTAAADPSRFPEQLPHVRPWQARRLVWNVARFGSSGPDTVPGRLPIDLGAYDPLLGRSYTEIAGESRSMHKSQGFGSAERRGTALNTFEHRLGERATQDLFEGVDLTWARVKGAGKLTALFERAEREFRPERPQAIVPTLLEARALLAGLPPDPDTAPLVAERLRDLDELLRSCLGLWVEAIAATPKVSPGGPVRIVTTAIARNDAPVVLDRVEILELAAAGTAGRALPTNVAVTDTFRVTVPAAFAPTVPDWLARPPVGASFEVTDPSRIGQPENAPVLTARFTMRVDGRPFVLDSPVVHRWVDPVHGERYRDVVVVPPALVSFEDEVTLFPDPSSRALRVVATATDRPVAGRVRLELPAGWTAEPAEARVALGRAGADTTLGFRVTPGAVPASGRVGATFVPEGGDGRAYALRLVELDYPHIPLQALLLPAEARVVRADVLHAGRNVGYIMGSGDAVPEALRQIGFAVTLLSDDDVEQGNLAGFDAIVVGVRAYNTRPRLVRAQKRLLDWVEKGGRLVVQYNTADGGLVDRLGPYPFTISRDRVTVEDAAMRPLLPGHPLLTTPNRIDADDFAGWVQERGLYFANPFDPRYEAPLSANDPGETAKDGGLLYARHGRGAFVYAAHAFFRQLPAGVPGAYRLFANLVSRDAPTGPGL
jgi:LmbE family N-acetylglucosaminyl deacetylase